MLEERNYGDAEGGEVLDGYELDAIIGALTMEEWEIKLDPKSQTLDLT